MVAKRIETVKEFIKSIPAFPKESLKLTESSLKLLKLVYERASNLPQKDKGEPLKPPLIISFHPKASLLNNNIHETFLATKIAPKLGMVPIWIPYIYDTGFKNAAEKIRRPSYVLFEGKYIPLRTSAAIRGNIIATEKAVSDKELKAFFRELDKILIATLTQMKTILNKFNFGHFLFDFKRDMSKISNKIIRNRLKEVEQLCFKAIKGTKKLDESFGKMSVSLLKEIGIDIGIVMMDDILVDCIRQVFSEVLEAPSVKKDPSLLSELFVAYDIKNRERTPIEYAGQGDFIAFDDTATKVFEGKFENLLEALQKHSVLPTGDLIMVLFTAMGCKLVLGGAHTIEYYPDYFTKVYSILKDTSFNSKMQLFSYGRIRFMDLRNMVDIMSAIRVFDKVGSRNYIQKGNFTLPRDVIDHLNFLSGRSEVPLEFLEYLDIIAKGETADKLTAIEKEEKRYEEVEEIVSKDPEELLKDPSTLKNWLRSTNFEGLHPIKLQILLEHLRQDVEMRLRKLKENLIFEQHVLGGTLKDPEEGEIIYDGILTRSNRYPTLLEMAFYKCFPFDRLQEGGIIEDHESEWIWKQFTQESGKKLDLDSMIFSDYPSVFNTLIPQEFITPLFRK